MTQLSTPVAPAGLGQLIEDIERELEESKRPQAPLPLEQPERALAAQQALGEMAGALEAELAAADTPDASDRLLRASVNRTAQEDKLFKGAPTDVSRLRRLNQIHRRFQLPELEDLPAELGSVGGTEEFGKQVSPEGLIEKVPFVGTAGAAIADLAMVLPAAGRAEKGEETQDDLEILAGALERMVQAARERTLSGKIVGGVAQLPTFAVEMGITGGLGTLGRKAAVKVAAKATSKAISKAVERFLLKRGIKGLTDVGAQVVAITAVKAPAEAVRRFMPEVRTDEDLELVTFEGETPLRALKNAGFDIAVEVGTERAGRPIAALGRFVLRPLRKALRIPDLKLSVREFFDRLGLQGPPVEMAEEVLAGVIKEGATRAGLVELPQPAPTFDDVLATGAVVSLPGGVRFVASQMVRERPQAAQRLVDAADKAVEVKGPRGVPSATDFIAEGVTEVKTRDERRNFVKALKEEFDAPSQPEVEQVARETPKKTETKVRKSAEPFDESAVIVPGPTAGPGFIAVDNVSGRIRRGASAIGTFLRRFLTSAGHLPRSVFEEKVLRNARINRLVREAVFNLQDFDRAAKAAYGGRTKMGAVETAKVDATLKNEAPLDSIPLGMREVVAKMRTNIDALSEALIDVGAIEGKLLERIRENLGVYVTRSYRVFDDPNWADKVSIEVRNKAKAWLRSEYPDKTEGQLAALIESLLFEGKAADSPIAILVRGRFLGTKDLSILRKRKDIPIELRLLWGEHDDARINYSRSILKMAHLIENQRFLNTVRADGLGKFLFEEPTIVEGENFVVRFDAKPGSALEPLNGLYTSLELKKAFERELLPADHGFFLRHYMRVNGVVKYSKTVASVMTHIRNLLGNNAFALAQGHWRVWNAAKAVRVTLTSLGAGSKAEFRTFFLRMTELGVVAESARAGELRDMIKDTSRMDANEFLGANADNLARRITRAATEAYRAEDDVWKIFAFLNEEARYKKAYPEWSQERIDKRAAHIVRNTYPTYSLIPEGVKLLRRFPAAGTFVSFPAEVIRTSYQTLRIIREELADPKTRSIAYTRMAGVTAAMTVTAAIAAASRAITGTTKTHDEDKRHFIPPWSRNSQLLHLGSVGDGVQRYIDLSYVDPYEYIKKPFTAFMRGGDWQSKVWEAGLEAADPFFSEEILAGKLFDIQRNKKPSGGRVYEPEDEFLKRQMDKLAHLYPAIEPGTLSRARKFVRGVRGEVSLYGRKYDPKLEAIAEFTGQRIVTLDVRQSLQFRARETSRRIRDATIVLSKVSRRRGTLKQGEFLDAHRRSVAARTSIVREASEIFHAAVRLGVPTKEVENEFRQSVSRETMHEIITDKPLTSSWLSNLLYKGTNASASTQDRIELRRALDWLDVSRVRANLLLGREYHWRNLKKGREVPPTGLPPLRDRGRTTGYGLRRRRLVRLLLERP